MKILHTADWHLADRLKQIDRTADLQRAVEQVAGYCDQHQVDVLLIAGDLLSELAKSESLQASVGHLSRTFRSFLLRGGTIVAIAGNHDSDLYWETLRRAFQLAAPNAARPGDILPGGRCYLTLRPVQFRLAGADGRPVQFVCLPYPTLARYLPHLAGSCSTTFDERNEQLRHAFVAQLRSLHQQLDPGQPRVLVAHINAGTRPDLRPLNSPADDDILLDDLTLWRDWDYVALGHRHAMGNVARLPHVWYSGSIDRLSIAEKDQNKGVLIAELPHASQAVAPHFLRMESTEFYDLVLTFPFPDPDQLRRQFPSAATALTRCHLRYRRGVDDLCKWLAVVSQVFPRCYERTWTAVSATRSHPIDVHSARTARPNEPTRHDDRGAPEEAVTAVASTVEVARSDSWQQSESREKLVISYLESRLGNDPDRDALLILARQLMEETP